MKNSTPLMKTSQALDLETLFLTNFVFGRSSLIHSQRKIKTNSRYGFQRIKITVDFDVRTQTELRISLKAKGLISFNVFNFMIPIQYKLLCSVLIVGEKHQIQRKRGWCACFCFHSPPEICRVRFHLTNRRDFLFRNEYCPFRFRYTCIFHSNFSKKGRKSKVYKMLRTSGIFY